MRPFEYLKPTSLEEAVAMLGAGEGAHLLAGGTDLLDRMKRGVSVPWQLVNLKSVPGLVGIRQEADGTLKIGALTCLSEVGEHSLVSRHYPLLAQAIQQMATPQIRNLATLGGSLCQGSRCWYYRHPDFACVRKQGKGCFAVQGQSRYHAIFGGHACFAVHPSDTAPALVALGAQVHIAGASSTRAVSLGAFFTDPRDNPVRDNVLMPGEILTEIELPAPPPGARGVFLKAAERRATDFALASVALQLAPADGLVNDVRIVLGGVAPVPWPLARVEALLRDGGLSDETIRRAGETATEGARPLPHNAFKIQLVRGLLEKALRLLRV